MTTGEAAKRLGMDRKTITNWLGEMDIQHFFSAGAKREKGGGHRTLNDDDLRILSTIRHLRVVDNVYDWGRIAEYLETGKRVEPPVLDGVTAHTESVSRPYAEQSAKAAATLAERDAAMSEVIRLRDELIQKDEQHREEVKALYDEIRRLEREIGKLEARLEHYD